MAGTDVSIVICTRNRAEKLRACLEHVREIETPRSWEVVVVDNGSTDDTPAVVEAARDVLTVPATLVDEPLEGVSRARNAGWRAASGSIVAYIDDDCYPAPEFVDRILERFENRPDLGYLGGAVLPYDPSDALVTIVAGRERIEIPPKGFVMPGLMVCANLAFRRRVLDEIGGFDVIFGYGAHFAGDVDAVIEDLDAAARTSAAGWAGAYDPDVVVRHHHGRRPGPDIEKLRHGYDIGRGAFYGKAALDSSLRKTYLVGWARLTADRVRRRESPGIVARELSGATRYLAKRMRG
jgi:glycosyltransferase involved in cell wall biosynthesis